MLVISDGPSTETEVAREDEIDRTLPRDVVRDDEIAPRVATEVGRLASTMEFPSTWTETTRRARARIPSRIGRSALILWRRIIRRSGIRG